ncbi:MAG: hypothetical protein ACJA01_003389 [Saprospiraceae bacterium]|jgi:hypothetical protein
MESPNHSRPNPSISQLSPHLFWEYDSDDLDILKDKDLIILRVLEYGLLEDWRFVEETYSIDEIRSAAVNSRSLDEVAMNFVAIYTKTAIEKFRCYKHFFTMDKKARA